MQQNESLANDLTILICSYKATKELSLCLNLLYRFNKKDNIMLIENSPAEYVENREFLNKHNIAYIDNPGGTHPETLNTYLKKVKTKYCLILDSDCFCLTDPNIILKYVIGNDIDLYGDICGDRGGYRLYKRVHPWYCFVNVEFLNKHNISFVDWEKVKKTQSEKFYSSMPVGIDRKIMHYDVGATMFEDILNKGRSYRRDDV